ncbi:hypothetical protein MRX96_020211 [Rhipicephalus microplus]
MYCSGRVSLAHVDPSSDRAVCICPFDVVARGKPSQTRHARHEVAVQGATEGVSRNEERLRCFVRLSDLIVGSDRKREHRRPTGPEDG